MVNIEIHLKFRCWFADSVVLRKKLCMFFEYFIGMGVSEWEKATRKICRSVKMQINSNLHSNQMIQYWKCCKFVENTNLNISFKSISNLTLWIYIHGLFRWIEKMFTTQNLKLICKSDIQHQQPATCQPQWQNVRCRGEEKKSIKTEFAL